MSVEITNVVQGFFEAVDTRNWDAAEALMTNPFHLDYSSYGAGPAADLAPTDILSGWQSVLPGFDATHHQLGPLIIEETGDRAQVRAYVTADHQIAGAENGEVWTVYGSYVLTLTKEGSDWRLRGNTFQFKFQTGNTDLPALAQSRAAACPLRR
jgi:hypothetical protein